MLYRLKVLITKEVLSYLRDPATRRLMIGAPILQTLIFGFAGTLDVRNLDVAIFDQDAGRWSYEVTARLDRASFTGELLTVHSQDDMAGLINRRKAVIGVRFPPEFSRQINSGRSAGFQVIVDGRRANAGQISVNYLGNIVNQLNGEIAAASTGSASAPAIPRIRVRHRYNNNLDYQWFMVASLAAVLPMMITLVTTSLSIAREREMGTFDQLLVAPVNSLEIILAKMGPGMIAGFVTWAILTLVAIYGFGIPFNGNLLLYAACTLIFILSVVGVGLMTSAICNTQQQAILGTFFGSTPFVLTGGFMTPYENMPEWLQTAALINPIHHFMQIVHGSFFKAMSFTQLWDSLWPLLIIGLVTLSGAVVIVRRNIR